ncbi:MAG TPA: hypothetical protein VK890_01935 [Bacteroidia bacterium]|jgi:hypothetical protein|nr:hypothetical protein [Bacteroidia bacterium]
MPQTTINVASNGQSLPGTSAIIHVNSNAGFSTSGSIVIFLASDGLATIVAYTGKGTNTFTGCSSTSSATMTSTPIADIVVDYATYLTTYLNTIQYDGQKKRMPANGVQGTPTSAYGEYNTFLPTQIGDISPVKYYQMTGFYVVGSTFESFVVTANPTPASTTNPNTGHALINTYVASFWTV